jgi:hypothetical protein
MGGGDLLNLLIERDTFEEDFTRFYIAEVIVRTLHAMNRHSPNADYVVDGSRHRVLP